MEKQPIPLPAEVAALLEANRGSWGVVAEKAGVSHSWISQFTRGLINNPGYLTLTKIRDVLKPTAEAT